MPGEPAGRGRQPGQAASESDEQTAAARGTDDAPNAGGQNTEGVTRPEEQEKGETAPDEARAELERIKAGAGGRGPRGTGNREEDDTVEGVPREEAMRRAAETTEQRRGPRDPEGAAIVGDTYAQGVAVRQYLASLTQQERNRLLESLEPVKPHDPTEPHTSMGPLRIHRPDQDPWKSAEQRHIDHNRRELARAMHDSPRGLVAVVTGREDDKVAFTEEHDWHPHGFAYVAGRDSPPAIVARTPAVEQALLASQIVRVDVPIPTAEQLEDTRSEEERQRQSLESQRSQADQTRRQEVAARRRG